jgi:hypothetical protein
MITTKMSAPMRNGKPFWDVEEKKGFVSIKGPDNVYYKVWNSDDEQENIASAIELSKVRRDFNKLLIYLYNNPQLWYDKPIAWGITHAFDIHIPCWKEFGNHVDWNPSTNDAINKSCERLGKLFNIQEMTPNPDGIIGLNKPKIIKTIKVDNNFGKPIDFELCDKRSIFLTTRNQRTGKVNEYDKNILPLALHELTHTVNNDTRWKEDNHLPPYQSYHTFVRKCARDCGVLK